MTKSSRRNQFFELSEVEYILSGFPQDTLCASDMALRLLFFRFALNAIYEFAAHYTGNLLATLPIALIEGYQKASQELVQLYEGKKIPAMPGQNVIQMSYGDHLMLFLMIQDNRTQFGRMASLMQANLSHWRQEGVPVSGEGHGEILIGLGGQSYVVGLTGRVSVRVHLWPFDAVIERERTMRYE